MMRPPMSPDARRFLAGASALLFLSVSVVAPAAAQAPAANGNTAAEVGAAVGKDPDKVVQIVVDAVVSHPPNAAAVIVAAAVGALSPAQRKAMAPSVVGAAIRALPGADRIPLAPGCACAAIRVIPSSEHREVVPPVIVAAVNAASEARPRIRQCATDEAPALASEINALVAALAAPLPLVDADATTGSPLPGGSLGRDALGQQRCASPPCPG
jgi:hypothetical protein